MEFARLFIGLPLPESYQQTIAELGTLARQSLCSKLTTTRHGNAHITLLFLGEVDPAGIEPIRTALSSIQWNSFLLQAGGAGAFPNAGAPSILWAGLNAGPDKTTMLHTTIRNALAPLGIPNEGKMFRPHVTVCRIKKRAPEDKGKWKELLARMGTRKWAPLRAEKFVLWQSRLGGDGPAYSRLAEFSATDASGSDD